jgi:hypothetical protein
MTRLTPQEDSLNSFLTGLVNLRAIVWLEELGQLKNPMTLSGFEPTTFLLVEECINQLSYSVHRLHKQGTI